MLTIDAAETRIVHRLLRKRIREVGSEEEKKKDVLDLKKMPWKLPHSAITFGVCFFYMRPLHLHS